MFKLLQKRQPIELRDYTEEARAYLRSQYQPPKKPKNDVRFSRETDSGAKQQKDASQSPRKPGGVKYSLPADRPPKNEDVRYSVGPLPDYFNQDRVTRLMQSADTLTPKELIRQLDNTLNQTFTDKLIELINEKGMRDSAVYRAAQMDRRLFSKIMSNREFKPAKDTALALIIALRLTLPQATDLLSRAGYTLSHSNKRDVIIEYFIREGIYNLMEVNLVLENLELKIIGR